MADKILSSLIGGGGVFITRLLSGNLSIAAGASGDLVTLTPPSGQRVSLDYLQVSGATSEGNMSVLVNGNTVISGTLDDSNSTSIIGRYSIGARSSPTAGAQIEPITGDIDEPIIIRKTSGTVGAAIYYSYRFGE